VDAASWIAGAWAWGVPATLQGTVLLGLAWLADRLLVRRAWPQVLSILWMLALARFFLPPDLGSPVSVTRGLGAPALAAAEITPSAEILATIVAVWLVGVLACLAARAAGRIRLRRELREVELPREWKRALARAARRLRRGARRIPRVATLDSLATPAVHGVLVPVLLLPRPWIGRRPARSDEHALLHELAHVARRDLLADEVVALVRAVLWFHPLVWIAADRLHALAELQCDQTVARVLGSDARSYRSSLVLAARDVLAPRTPAGVRSFLGHGNALVLRIERLERATIRSLVLVRGATAALCVAIAACVLPMAPAAADLRDQARATLAAVARGERVSCFTFRAAAMALAADSQGIEPSAPSPTSR
jgi:beta-lactamase regulating signal transducer with metallopeptidase domain